MPVLWLVEVFISSKSHKQLPNCVFVCPADGRKVAAQVRGIGMVPTELPEWKKQVMGGAKASFGRKEKKSILEQRQGLPIFKLKDELLKVREFVCCTSDSGWIGILC